MRLALSRQEPALLTRGNVPVMKIAVVGVVVLTSCIIVGLLAFILWISLNHMSAGTIADFAGLDNYVKLFQNDSFWTSARNTIEYGAITLLVAFFFGVPLAWLTERTTFPGRALVWAAMLASLIVPGFLLAMGWLFLAHPRIGILNIVLMQWFHLSEAPLPVTNVVGMGWVEGIALAPLVFILIAPSLQTMDAAFEEAARASGASFRNVVTKITLPLLAPGLVAAAIYTSINAIGAFDVPAVIGLSNRTYTFSTFMYASAYPVAGFPNYSTTSAGGGLMIVFALLMSWGYASVLRRARRYTVVTGKSYRPTRIELGRWKIAAWGFAGIYAFFVLVLPFSLTLAIALLPYPQPLTFEALSHASLANFAHVPWDLILRGLVHTLEIVAIVPLAVVALSCAFSWTVLRTRLPGRFVIDSIAFLPHAVPGVLFGVAATLLALFVLQRFLPIYGTVAMIMIVYSIAWISFGTRMVNASLIQIHQELDEAGRMSGASPGEIARLITLPLLRGTMSGLWIFIVLLCLRELTLAAFVSTPSNITLPMVSWFLWTDSQLTKSAAVAVIVTVALAPLLLIYLRFGRRNAALF
jgi:iron(III) transport system permease protein